MFTSTILNDWLAYRIPLARTATNEQILEISGMLFLYATDYYLEISHPSEALPCLAAALCTNSSHVSNRIYENLADEVEPVLRKELTDCIESLDTAIATNNPEYPFWEEEEGHSPSSLLIALAEAAKHSTVYTLAILTQINALALADIVVIRSHKSIGVGNCGQRVGFFVGDHLSARIRDGSLEKEIHREALLDILSSIKLSKSLPWLFSHEA